jgi:hypothetical protein
MDLIHELLTFSKLGLFLNVVGTVMVAFSFGKNLEEAHQLDKKGRKVYLASFLYPKLFKWGLFIIILGFVLQFLA